MGGLNRPDRSRSRRDRRASRSPACGDGGARSLQSVSDQELEGAVEADVRQHRTSRIPALEMRRPKAKKAKIAFFRGRAGKALKRAVALEELFGIGRQIARKGRDLGLAVEGL